MAGEQATRRFETLQHSQLEDHTASAHWAAPSPSNQRGRGLSLCERSLSLSLILSLPLSFSVFLSSM